MNNSRNMNPIFSLKNFRSFGEDGADFELAPITVLTGCNSAGKSSLVKALMLMSKQSAGNKGSIAFFDTKKIQPNVDLRTSQKEFRLGGFNSVINEHSKDGTLSFSYKIWSNYLNEEVICRRLFRANKKIISEGRLVECSIEKSNGKIIYKAIPTVSGCFVQHEYLEDTIVDNDFELFKEIEKQYEVFSLNCKCIGLQEKIERVKKGIEIELGKCADVGKYEDILKECQMDLENTKKILGDDYSLDYDKRIVYLWNNRWTNSKMDNWDRLWIECLTAEEKADMDKELFYALMVNEIVSPWFFDSLSYIDSSTNEIKRVYNVENSDKLSSLLNSLLKRVRSREIIVEGQSRLAYQTGCFVNKWLKRFRIGDKLEIVCTDEDLGVKVYLVKNGSKRLLADEGYGITQLISILLQIEVNNSKFCSHKVNDNYEDVNEWSRHILCIEEPEVHLHPMYQSLLADLFVEAYQKFNTQFIIETHSEYLIRKLQVLVADKENALAPNDISLNYVEKDESGGSMNRKIDILEDGGLSDTFGSGFYDEADALAMDLFRKKPILS